MSATGRGSERNEDDFYATPAWCVHRLLEKLTLPAGRWLEPGAGNGAIIQGVGARLGRLDWTAIDLVSRRSGLRIDSETLRQVDLAWHIGDFLADAMILLAGKVTAGRGFDVAIGNPPYKLAQAFADRCFQLASQTVLLLRLNFLGSEERAAWWAKHPADVYVLPNRPSFCVKVKCVVEACSRQETYGTHEKLPEFCLACHGKLKITRTDATEYAWFVWPGAGQLYHLALTPESERYNRAPMPKQEKHP